MKTHKVTNDFSSTQVYSEDRYSAMPRWRASDRPGSPALQFFQNIKICRTAVTIQNITVIKHLQNH